MGRRPAKHVSTLWRTHYRADVAETNHAAVVVYEREGFTIVGTVPGAFRHPVHGRVGLHVTYVEL